MIEIVIGVMDAVCEETLVSISGKRLPETLVGSLEQVPDERSIVAERDIATPRPVKAGGPLAGIRACMQRARTDWILALACDMPRITAAALTELCQAAGPDVEAVVARGPDGRVHPLPGCYRVALLPMVENQLESGRLALHEFLERVQRVSIVDLPDAVLVNINRPKDLT
jgi:molybdopterin-guanine dinucleotide biosynthesis protein A